MFTAVPVDPLPYTDPWNIPVDKRIAALSSRTQRIVYFYARPDTSTFRYRVFNMVEALEASPDLGVSAAWFCQDDVALVDSFLDRADALVICRAWYNSGVNQIVAKARARGIPVMFDVDDLIFDTDYTHLIMETLDQKPNTEDAWNHWFGMIGRIGRTLRLCDNAITTNDFLADKIKAFAPWMQPRVIPNFLNRKQQAKSDEIYAAKLASGFSRDGNLAIGYFSGTPTHNRDFEIVASAAERLLAKYAHLVLCIVGFLDMPDCLVEHRERVRFYPLQDFVNLQRLIGKTEINIAPLQMNDFTNCKSELKFFEAAIVGTLTLATPTYTFVSAIRTRETALLCGEEEWETQMIRAIDVVDNVARYTEMAEAAHAYATSRYNWHCYGNKIKSAVFESNDTNLCRPGS